MIKDTSLLIVKIKQLSYGIQGVSLIVKEYMLATPTLLLLLFIIYLLYVRSR